MRYSRIVTIVAAGAAAFALGGAAAQGGAGAPHGPGHHGAAAGAATMPHMMSGSSELDFLAHMIEHHREAVSSAEALLAVAQRDELIALAREVIEAQQIEIDMMQAWLDEWYPEWEPMHDYVPMMRPLAGLAPAESERAWVEDMIAHHMMAVHEAQTLLAGSLSDRPEVLELARSIVRDQRREIATMQRWLRDWFGVAGGAPLGLAGPGPHGPMMAGARRGHGTMGMCAMAGMMGMAGTARTMPGTMGMMHGHSDGETIAEALARAYLDGRASTGSIVRVEPPANVYRVTYSEDGVERVLLIDTTTLTVTDE